MDEISVKIYNQIIDRFEDTSKEDIYVYGQSQLAYAKGFIECCIKQNQIDYKQALNILNEVTEVIVRHLENHLEYEIENNHNIIKG